MRSTRPLPPLAVAVLSAAIAVTAPWALGCRRSEKPVEVVLTLDKARSSLSDATLIVDYSRAGARPETSGGAPACTSLLPFIDTTFEDDGNGRLTVHARSSAGFSAPIDLAACRMIPNHEGMDSRTIASALTITLADARDTDGKALGERQLARSGSGARIASTAPEEPLEPPRPHMEPRAEPTLEELQARSVARREAARGQSPSRIEPPQAATRGVERPSGGSEARSAGRPRQGGLIRPGADRLASGGSRMAGSAGASGSAAGSSDGSGSQGEAGGGSGGNTSAPSGGESATPYGITISVLSQSGNLGALQFSVQYAGSSGGFVGATDSVDCVSLIDSALPAFTNKDNGRMDGALISINGFRTPSAVASCTFKSREFVTPGSFNVSVVDASDVETNPIDKVFMAVTDVHALN